jgi:hypothetical protein
MTMSYLEIELARTLDEDRYREAAHCRHVNKALATGQEQLTHPFQILVRWLQSLATQEQRVASEQQIRTLAKLS